MKFNTPESYLLTPALFCSMQPVADILALQKILPLKHAFFSKRPRCFLVAEDCKTSADALLKYPELGTIYADDRFEWFTGKNAWTLFGRYAHDNPGQCDSFQIYHAQPRHDFLIGQVIAQTKHKFEPRPLPKVRPAFPKILVYKIKQSTVIGYAAQKMANAFEKAGCEVFVTSEKTEFDRPSEFELIKAVNETRPDLIFNLGTPVNAYHGKIPAYTWCQDPPRELFSSSEPWIPITHSTCMPVTHTLNRLYRQAGANVFNLPMAADPDDYEYQEPSLYEFDLSFVSHVDRGDIDKRYFNTLIEAGVNSFENGSPVSGFEPDRCAGMVIDALKKAHLHDSARNNSYISYYITAIERIAFRIFWMRKIAALCDSKDYKLGLFGRGWGEYPEFMKYAHGPTTLSQTRGVFSKTRVNIHMNPFTNMHQRVLEAGLSGQFIMFPEIWHDDSETGVARYLKKGSEYVSMKDEFELVYYLENEPARKSVTEAARRRILNEHTYDSRVETILQDYRNPCKAQG